MTNGNDLVFEERVIYRCAIISGGLTKREYFAAMALQGMLSRVDTSDVKYLTERATKISDALINELNKQP